MTTAKPNPHKGYTLSSFHHNEDEFRSRTLKLMPNPCVTGGNRYYIKSKKRLPLITLMLAVLGVNTAHAALSATTAQTIKGSAPYLVLSDGTKLTNLAQLQGFTMPKRDGSTGREQIDSSMVGTTLVVPVGMKFKDVTLLVAADGNSHTIPNTAVKDDEGDATILSNTSTTGSIKATWYEGTTLISNLNQPLTACNGGSYTLKVEILTVVGANTQYGVPNTNTYGTNTAKTYSFIAQPGICYIKPKDLTVYNNQYNSTYFTVGKGFNSVNLNVNNKPFPTTGFPYAVLQIIGSGSNQSQYECKISSGAAWVTLSTATGAGINCTVTYNATSGSKPTTPFTIQLGTTVSGSYVPLDTYTIPAPTLWAEAGNPAKIGTPYSSTYSDNIIPYNLAMNFSDRYLAAESCYLGAGVSPPITGVAMRTTASIRFFSTSQITNGSTTNKYTRTPDGTFMGEWGALEQGSGVGYFGSPWVSDFSAWAGDGSGTSQNVAHLAVGTYQSAADPRAWYPVVCSR